jgi:hypothetical protein
VCLVMGGDFVWQMSVCVRETRREELLIIIVNESWR